MPSDARPPEAPLSSHSPRPSAGGRGVAGEAGTRERLVLAMADALRHRGYHGIGLNELLAAAQAPKGVLYHHFPGGKSALAVAAIGHVAAQLEAQLDLLIARRAEPVAALRRWMGAAEGLLGDSGFERGCPLATVALESTGDDPALRAALADAFARLRAKVAAVLCAGSGVDAARADALAALIVATYEGALMQARVAGSVAPMTASAEALLQLLARELAAAPRDAPPRDPPATADPDRRCAD
jgi:TetR/AcrR family transcriptional repressor of lmrAB and yxaGH operons